MAPFPKAAEAWPYVSLISPIVALAANVAAQLVLLRVRRGARFVRCIVESVALGALVGLALEIGLIVARDAPVGTQIMSLVVNALTYLALSYGYYHFVQLGHTSIRIRIYSEIAASERGLTSQEITGRYDDGALMQLRFQRLLESGDIVQRNGRYFVARARFVLVSNVLFAAKRLMLGRNSEFDGPETGAPDPARRKDEGF